MFLPDPRGNALGLESFADRSRLFAKWHQAGPGQTPVLSKTTCRLAADHVTHPPVSDNKHSRTVTMGAKNVRRRDE